MKGRQAMSFFHTDPTYDDHERGDGPAPGDGIGRALYAELTRALAALDARGDYVCGRYANAMDAADHDDDDAHAHYWAGHIAAVNTARADIRAILRVYAVLA
jgi:hypothetical protein